MILAPGVKLDFQTLSRFPFMKKPPSVPQSTHFKEGLHFLLMLIVQLLRTSPEREQSICII